MVETTRFCAPYDSLVQSVSLGSIHIVFCWDLELACDESAVRDLTLEERKSYSYALLSCSMQRRLVTVCPLAFGEVGVKKRVKEVLNYKKPSFWILLAAVVVCVIVAVCFLTNPKDGTTIVLTNEAGTCPFQYGSL